MLRRLSAAERLNLLAEQFEPLLRKAFLDAVANIRDNIVLRRIVERLEKGDVNGAIRAMNLDETAFHPLEEAIRQAFNGGGIAAVEQMPILRDPDGHKVVLRWGVRNLAAEQWLSEKSTTLVRDIVVDQVEGIRTTLSASLARGDNPTKTAIDVVGRVNRVTGKREGGILGLTSHQAGFVENARQELLSGDPAALKNYLARSRRDKRFDRTVSKAIADQKPLPVATVEKIAGRYSEGLLKLRGDTIALQETMAALAASKDEAFRQQIEKGTLLAVHVTKTWKHTPQEHPRVQHVAMQGQTVRFDEPFIAPDGTAISYPHAPGVPAKHAIGCKCLAFYSISFGEQIAWRNGR